MSNIAIVNYCNLKCPYCFAEDMIKEENTFMSLDDYNKLLDFILKNP
jgi:sulfatase maturation enzyme AslB (radical SAM superfamily)